MLELADDDEDLDSVRAARRKLSIGHRQVIRLQLQIIIKCRGRRRKLSIGQRQVIRLQFHPDDDFGLQLQITTSDYN